MVSGFSATLFNSFSPQTGLIRFLSSSTATMVFNGRVGGLVKALLATWPVADWY